MHSHVQKEKVLHFARPYGKKLVSREPSALSRAAVKPPTSEKSIEALDIKWDAFFNLITTNAAAFPPLRLERSRHLLLNNFSGPDSPNSSRGISNHCQRQNRKGLPGTQLRLDSCFCSPSILLQRPPPKDPLVPECTLKTCPHGPPDSPLNKGVNNRSHDHCRNPA